MGWKEFVASVIGSLAWPLVILVLVLVVLVNFRTQLRALIARTKSVKGGGIEAAFGEQLEEAKDNAEALLEKANVPDRAESTAPDLAEPVDGIIQAWEALESTVRVLYQRALGQPELQGIRVPPVRVMLDQMLGVYVIDRAFRETVFRLLELRNKVAHGHYRPTREEAASYATTVSDMIDYAVITKQEYLSDQPLLTHRATI